MFYAAKVQQIFDICKYFVVFIRKINKLKEFFFLTTD